MTAITFDSAPDPLVVRAAEMTAVQRLAASSPSPRTARVSGALDSLRVSTGAFWIVPEREPPLRGIFSNRALDAAKGLLGERVTVEGLVSFKPSGAPQRIEASAIRRATDADARWAQTPRASRRRAAPAPADGSYLVGDWPGDETDEELDTALREVS